MDHDRFDQIARTVSSRLSRRAAAGALGLGSLGLAALGPAEVATAKKGKKKVKTNEFGCVDVGKFCKKSDQCCSGICQGKKNKKKCKAHNEVTCQNGQREEFCGGTVVPCQTPNGDNKGGCNTTTGKAGYCTRDGVCFACNKDADCVSRCGPQAACVLCAGCTETGGRGCAGPEADSCIDVM